MAEISVLMTDDVRVILHGAVDNDNPKSRALPLRQRPDGRLMGYVLNTGHTVSGVEEEIELEDDGTPRGQLILWEYTGGTQIRAAAEQTTGEMRVSLYGTDTGGAIRGIENETTGELRVVMTGADEANNIDRIRTDPNRIIWTRAYEEPYYYGSIAIPAAEGDLWNPGLADTYRFAVEFNVVNDAVGAIAATGVYVGREINSAGGLASPYYWLFDETIPYPGETGWCGPYIIHGDDAVRGVRAAAGPCSITFRVKRVDTGA
jgi:hypothetical protein